MEKIVFGYSLKNIPIPTKNTYLKSMISKVESFITRMRWKAIFFLNKKDEEDEEEEEENEFHSSYGFKSDIVPPKVKELISFEEDIYNLISSINFNKNNKTNHFQKKLKNDVNIIRRSDKIFVPADKTTNIYQIEPEQYNALLLENITKEYKKTNNEELRKVNKEACKLATEINLQDKMECIPNNKAFITLKDHKDNFINNPKCRLINPAKTEMGKISSIKLKEINSELRSKLNLNQWRNTADALKWFNNIENNNNKKFFQLDIVEFYPSISEELLNETLNFASDTINLDKDTIDIIRHSRKSFLFNDQYVWKKKSNDSFFDVTMGSYDGAEICELVGIYLTNLIKNKLPMLNFGLYRDDGLGTHDKLPGPQISKIQKDLIKIFKSKNLKITSSFNLTQVDFLDVTLNLNTKKFWPYKKPNDQPMYINKMSNHPQTIKNELPKMINKRLCEISCNNCEFEKHKEPYEQALKKSGYTEKLAYSKPINKNKKRCRKRKVIWFNPPFNMNVKTQVGKLMLNLIDKHFPKKSKLHKIFNRNTIKISYSCMPNMKAIINQHNNNILNKDINNDMPNCNCRNKNECPIKDNCQTETVVYKATIKSQRGETNYIGSCETSFKKRYYNHKKSFNNEQYKHETSLSNYIWNLKEDQINYDINWEIIQKCKPYKCTTRKCQLCLSEKLLIMQHASDPSIHLLNSRSEIMNKCRHNTKFKLSRVK